MGLFNDNVSPHRNEWTYRYTGRELLSAATELYKQFYEQEQTARNKMVDLMKDMNVSQSDPRVAEAKRDIQTFGSQKEQCQVFKHEFKRNPEKIYELGLGDVTFFGLANY